ncbi:uncharacterized protein N7511_006757 [Penicillium nucicola]|uniref:uncharacterized protein n=1 Tax=Penicillium nucicola TaxID=1850975 RepID=UPI002545612E|nr:uncharacterized protein N7511_006757 [Penicillium nucicola]KAJ5758063.1 hypothetical protein N7511_006757 [Penicillium nucicola]
MATVEKTKQQPKKLPVQEDLSDGEDYDSADDYTDEEEEEIPQPKKNKQVQRRKPLQQQDDDDSEYTDEDEYDDEYDDEYTDDEDAAMQPYSNNNSNFKPTGGMDVLHKEEKSMLDEEGMKLRLELNLEIEVELKARIHGDLTLALM